VTDGALPVVACDLDGVIWRGDQPITPAAEGIAKLRAGGLRVAFVSNNSNSPVTDVVAKLGRMGVPATAADVVTSAMAAAWLLARSLPAGARVLACAGPGVREALADVGLVAVDDGPADAVVVGFHREFDYDGLDRASAAVRAGARFVATNLDATYPIPGGLIPGAGALVAAVATAAGSRPEVAGKPEAPTVGIIRERFGTTGVVVGDRPSTDGALATALGWPFALVLSGVTAAVAPPGGEAIPDPPPPFVGADLGALAPALVTALVP
jgi:glycerol-1-phosphatase